MQALSIKTLSNGGHTSSPCLKLESQLFRNLSWVYMFRAAFWRINALHANTVLISAGGGLAERIQGGRHPPPGFTLLLLLSLPSPPRRLFLIQKGSSEQS